MAGKDKCEQCQAQGITILPTRLGCSIEVNGEGQAEIPYTQRLLREGYVYIVDNHNEWYGYVINQDHYLKQFNVNDLEKTPDLPLRDSTCLRGDNCQALNSFIRIPNPNKDIETLWLAYSPVKWTKVVIQRHENNTDGAKTNNMIEVAVSDIQSKNNTSLGERKAKNNGGYDLWRYDPDGDGVKPITQHHAYEYFGIINSLTKKPYQPNKSTENFGLAKTLIKIERESIENTGKENRALNVFFDDSIGQLIDLNKFVFQLGDSIDTRYSLTDIHKLDVAYKIEGLENWIKSGARTKVINDYIEKKMSAQKGQYTSYKGARGQIQVIDYEKKEKIRSEIKLTLSEQQEATSNADLKAEKVWADYAELYKKSEMEAFLTSGMGKKIEGDNNRILKTLLDKHQEIYESEYYRQQMLYNFDTQDIASGVAYLENILVSIGITVNYPQCIKRYADDISTKTLKQDNNFILRALVYNYQPVIDEIIKESEKSTPWSSLTQAAWASIFNNGANLYASNILRNSVASQTAVANLSAPLMKVLKEQANKSALSEATYAIGFHIQKEITRIDFTGRRHQAISLLSGLLDKENTSASNSTINRFAISIINQLKVEGNAHFGQGISGHMLALIDMKKAANILDTLELPSTSTSQGKQERINIINESAKPALINKGRIYDISSEEFKRFVDPHTKPSSPSAKLAMVGGMFQTIACASLLYSAINGSESTQSNEIAKLIENSEGWTKLAGGLGFLMGGALDNHAHRLEIQLTNPALSESQYESKNKQFGKVDKWATRINIGSGAIFAMFDVYHAYDEYGKGNTGMSGLFIISAVSGMGSVVLIGSTATLTAAGVSMSWNAIGWALLAVSIGVGIFISLISNNPLEEWIENSIWGVDNLQLSYENDIKAYVLAIQKFGIAEPSEEAVEPTSKPSVSTVNQMARNRPKTLDRAIKGMTRNGETSDHKPYSDEETAKLLEGYKPYSDEETAKLLEGYKPYSDEETAKLLEGYNPSDEETYKLPKLEGVAKRREENQEPYYVFSVVGLGDTNSSGTGLLSDDVKTDLQSARQKTADAAKRLHNSQNQLSSYGKTIKEQNQRLKDLQNKLNKLRNK